MNEKRYAIVEIECPPKNEIDAQFVCFPGDNDCSGCRYGDTVKQFENKVATAIEREVQQRSITIQYKNFTLRMPVKYLARMIVKFLGMTE